MHAISIHKQVIDATYTCEICQTVCRDFKGLRVHKGHVHDRRAITAQQNEGALLLERKRLRDEENVSCSAHLSLVACPVCAQAYSREETEEHIGVHDSEVGKMYCEMSKAAKLLMAETVMKALNSQKLEE
jgi:hypothetical protein